MNERAARRIVQVTSVHPWGDTRIFWRECVTLADAGYDVTLIAPGAESVVTEGVRLLGLPVPRSRWGRIARTGARVLRMAAELEPDLVHIHDPELLPWALYTKRRHGMAMVYDVHEDVPLQMRGKYYLPRVLRTPLALFANGVEKTTARQLDAVVAATPQIARQFPADRTVTVQNFPPRPAGGGAGPADDYAERPPNVVYVGALSATRGMVELVDALARLESQEAHLDLVGTFRPETLRHELEARPGWRRVHHHGWVPRDRVPGILARARVGVVTLHPTRSYVESYPTKMFEYMAAGLPVVASDFPLWREILQEREAGLVVDPRDPEAIAEAVGWLLAHPSEAKRMGERGRQAVLDRYHWEREGDKLVRLYGDLLK
jgi:glycosyltransferase involved in cell wall biosynthesis